MDKLLPRYLSGELSDEYRSMIEQWRENSPKNEVLFQKALRAREAMALLQEMEQFNSFEALKKIDSRLSRANTTSWWKSIQRVAAVLLVPLLAYSGYVTLNNISFHKLTEGQVVMQTVTSRQGMVSKFILADGTMVWLNSGSELQFPLHFTGDVRNVKLRGEAFFKVTKNDKQPFRVNANELNIEVLGTSFDVSSYEEEKQSEVILVEGKVSLSTGKDNRTTEYGTMRPGQRAVYKAETQKVYAEVVNVDKYIAWRDGNLIFRDDKMEDVVKRLSRWFNVEIVINDPIIKSYTYKATFRNENLIQVLNLLKLSAPIDYKILECKALSDGEFTKQKVYLMKKRS